MSELSFRISDVCGCHYCPHDDSVNLCPIHLNNNPVPSIVHELCERDVMFTMAKFDQPIDGMIDGVYVSHIVAPSKGIGRGRCPF